MPQSTIRPIHVTGPSSVPKEKHWVIFKGGSTYTPGDERSRTNPGHGYSASTSYHLEYEAYLDEADWRAEIQRLEDEASKGRRTEYSVAVVQPAEVKTEASVTVSAKP